MLCEEVRLNEMKIPDQILLVLRILVMGKEVLLTEYPISINLNARNIMSNKEWVIYKTNNLANNIKEFIAHMLYVLLNELQ